MIFVCPERYDSLKHSMIASSTIAAECTSEDWQHNRETTWNDPAENSLSSRSVPKSLGSLRVTMPVKDLRPSADVVDLADC